MYWLSASCLATITLDYNHWTTFGQTFLAPCSSWSTASCCWSWPLTCWEAPCRTGGTCPGSRPSRPSLSGCSWDRAAGHSCNISRDQEKIFYPSTWSHLWPRWCIQVFMFLFMSRNYLCKVSPKTTEIDVDIKLYPTLTHLIQMAPKQAYKVTSHLWTCGLTPRPCSRGWGWSRPRPPLTPGPCCRPHSWRKSLGSLFQIVYEPHNWGSR